MHPADMDDLGIESGDVVRIESEHGTIFALAHVDEGLRRGGS